MVDIWVPKPILEPKDPLTARGRVEGRVRLKVFKEGVKEPRVDTGWFKNLVLDGGLDRLGTTVIDNAINRCAVGTSNTAVSSSQTALLAQVATSIDTFSPGFTQGYDGTYGVGDGRYRYSRRFIQFGEGAAAGVLREIGFTAFGDSSATNLTSRALITDGAGNPTDVTVLSDEILQVTYEFRHYLDDSDGSIAFEMSGVPYTGIYRPGGEISGNGSQLYPGTSGTGFQTGGTSSTFGAAGTNISSTSGSRPGNGTLSAYSNGDYYRDVSYPFSLAQGNATGGILMFGWNQDSPGYKFLLDTPIPKDNTKLMTLNIRTSWGRK
jgi:hypothetical protein